MRIVEVEHSPNTKSHSFPFPKNTICGNLQTFGPFCCTFPINSKHQTIQHPSHSACLPHKNAAPLSWYLRNIRSRKANYLIYNTFLPSYHEPPISRKAFMLNNAWSYNPKSSSSQLQQNYILMPVLQSSLMQRLPTQQALHQVVGNVESISTNMLKNLTTESNLA